MAAPKTISRKIPAPAVTLDAQPFWDACAQGKFLIKRCKACGEPHFYPRPLCPFCFSDKTDWEEAKGEGAIYSFSIMRHNTKEPYAIGYVTLDEGPSVLTNFVDCDFAQLKIGMRVKALFQPTENGPPVPVFTPA